MIPSPFSYIQIFRANFYWLAEHLLRRTLFSYFFDKKVKKHRLDLLDTLKTIEKNKEVYIDEISNLSPRDFFYKYFLKNRPVILKGAAKNWKCMKWNFDFFLDKFGQEETMVTDENDQNFDSLKEIILQLRSGNLKSARICNVLQNHQELLQDVDINHLKKYIPFCSFTTSHQFFLGAKGNITPLHAGATNNFSIQLHGTKIWRLIDPNFNPVINPIINQEPLFRSYLDPKNKNSDKYPEVDYIPIIIAKLEPGDILFNPTFYWHHVSYESESITIGLRWLNLYNLIRSSITMGALLATATNPPAILSFLNIHKGKTTPFYK